jgi:hypothetical protein
VGVDLGYTLLIGLAATRLTELWKEVMIRLELHQVAWFKASVNLVCCGLLVLLVMHRPAETKVLIALGASGLSMVIHSVDTGIRHYRDRTVGEVLDRRTPRRRG